MLLQTLNTTTQNRRRRPIVTTSTQFETTFDNLAGYSSWTPTTNTTFYSRPAETEPASKASTVNTPSYTDQRFGTAVYSATKIADVGGSISHLRNDYARHIAFNCDSTYYIAVTSDSYWHLYDANTFAHIDGGRTGTNGQNGALLGIIGSDCEPIWHPTNPNKLWYTSDFGGLIWYELDVTTGVSTTLFNFTGRLGALGMGTGARTSFGGEGRPSNDGRYWALMVKTSGYGMLGLLMYDRQADTFLGSVTTTNAPNNITTSPLGNYAVPCWSNFTANSLSTSAAASINSTDGARAYLPDFSAFEQLSNTEQHADVALDVSGNEVYVSVNFSSGTLIPDVSEGYTYYRRMDTGVAVQLPLTAYGGGSDTGIHFSGGGYRRPGWALCNLYGGTPSTWKDGCLMGLELKPSAQRVVRFAHHQSSGATYWVDPLACVNADFTRILYGSDFRRGATPGVGFMVGLPSDWDTR